MVMRLSPTIRAQFQRQGRRGGNTRAERLSAAVRKSIARHAALRRWIRVRFGEAEFAALGLPGGDLIDRGLADLAAERETLDSLSISLAAPRLRREGIPLPALLFADADRRLYRLLERTDGELAHARYLARLRQVASFADACCARFTEGRRAR